MKDMDRKQFPYTKLTRNVIPLQLEPEIWFLFSAAPEFLVHVQLLSNKSGLSTTSSRNEHYLIIKTRFLFRFVHKYFGTIIRYTAIKDNIETSRYKKCKMTLFLNALPYI